MPTTNALPAALAKAVPITWPSLTDLAASLYGRARGLDTLGREVRRLRVKTRKIGRELRVEPSGAIRVLEARGLTVQQATAVVTRAVEVRRQEVPAMAEPHEERTTTRTPTLAQRYRDPVVAAASRRYAELHRPTLILPQGRADFSTDDLMREIAGGQA